MELLGGLANWDQWPLVGVLLERDLLSADALAQSYFRVTASTSLGHVV